MNNLYELISVATDVIDMTITYLTSRAMNVEAIVQRVQTIGKAWDDHPTLAYAYPALQVKDSDLEMK
jgi:serine/threonine-protein kinase RIM15